MLLIITLLFLTVYNCRATRIADAGLLASAPAIRNFLIVTGLGYKVDQQGSLLYELSGFQYLSEPANPGKRNASTLYHSVVEVDPNAVSSRSDRVKRDHPLHEERGHVERIFNTLRSMERNTCIFKLLCDIGYSSESFGILGRKIERYVRSIPAVTWNSATSPYVEAFFLGVGGEQSTCMTLYGSCPYNLRRILPLLTPTL